MSDESLRPYFWMLCGCFCFSWMATCARWCKDFFPWQDVAIARSAIPLIVVGAWAWWAGVRFAVLRPPILWMRSIAGSLSLVATFYAIPKLPISDVFTLTNLFPIWVALLSWPMLGEMPPGKVWICAVIGLVGVFVLQQPHFETGINAGALAAISASLTTAFAMIGLNQLRDLDSRAVVTHFSGVSLAFALLACVFADRPTVELVPTNWAWIVLSLVGLLAVFGQMFLTKAFTNGDAAKLSVVGLTQVALTLLLEAFVLGHRPTPEKLIGIPLVLGPTAWLMLGGRPLRRPPKIELDAPVEEDEILVRNADAP